MAWVSLLTENLSPTGSWQALVTSGPAAAAGYFSSSDSGRFGGILPLLSESQGRAGPRKLGAYSGSNVQDINSLLMTAHESKHM